jgi:hypothetical protein
VIVVQSRPTYVPPIIVDRPVVSSYYAAPPVTTYSPAPVTTYSYYPSPSVVTYSAPPVVTYSAPPPYITYAAPAAIVTTPRVVETRSYYGFGILRPRGWTTETRVYP